MVSVATDSAVWQWTRGEEVMVEGLLHNQEFGGDIVAHSSQERLEWGTQSFWLLVWWDGSFHSREEQKAGVGDDAAGVPGVYDDRVQFEHLEAGADGRG
jgi:hypothetical protein